mgnify:CR=1 FL=1
MWWNKNLVLELDHINGITIIEFYIYNRHKQK